MGFGGILKQSTAIDVLIGPFLDETDGVTVEDSLTIAQADVRLSKNGQNMAQKNDATSCVHDEIGYYNCELDATDTNTVGTLVLAVNESGALAVRQDFQVVEEAVYAAFYASSATLNVNALSEIVENSLSLQKVISSMLSVLTGKASGNGLVFRNNADDTDRVTVTSDANGNRSVVVIDTSDL